MPYDTSLTEHFPCEQSMMARQVSKLTKSGFSEHFCGTDDLIAL